MAQVTRDHLDRYTDPERLASHLEASHGERHATGDMDALRAAHEAAHEENDSS
jgi:hypothetical protein